MAVISLLCMPNSPLFAQFGIEVGSRSYTQVGEQGYYSLERRSVPSYQLTYNLMLGKTQGVIIGFTNFPRVADTYIVDTVTGIPSVACVAEEYFSIPILWNSSFLSRSGKFRSEFAVGGVLSACYKQNTHFPFGADAFTNTSVSLKNSDWFSYFKVGIEIRCGLVYRLSDRIEPFANVSTQYELDKLTVSKNDRQNFFYNSVAFNLGFRIRFKGGQDGKSQE